MGQGLAGVRLLAAGRGVSSGVPAVFGFLAVDCAMVVQFL